MASLTEMERDLPVERTRTELEVAKQLGRKGAQCIRYWQQPNQVIASML